MPNVPVSHAGAAAFGAAGVSALLSTTGKVPLWTSLCLLAIAVSVTIADLVDRHRRSRADTRAARYAIEADEEDRRMRARWEQDAATAAHAIPDPSARAAALLEVARLRQPPPTSGPP